MERVWNGSPGAMMDVCVKKDFRHMTSIKVNTDHDVSWKLKLLSFISAAPNTILQWGTIFPCPSTLPFF
jgi:hypothetical protein